MEKQREESAFVSEAGKCWTTQTLGFENGKKEETLVDSGLRVTHGNPNGGENSMKNTERIPTDLMIEIFSRLPGKSVGRFRCLSKQWCSVLRCPAFTRSRSSARPRLMLAVTHKGSRSFFTSPQSPSSSLVVTADFHSRFSEDGCRFTCSHASGLFYFCDPWIPQAGGQLHFVCNPITGRFVRLPEVDMNRDSSGFLGYDPIENKFKVLAESYPFYSSGDLHDHEVLTLGTGNLSWRKKNVDCRQNDSSLNEGICIDGVLYHLVDKFSDKPGTVVHFDVRSEEFRVIAAECITDPNTTLVNYKGKLGGIECIYGEDGGRLTLELRLCVLENVERHEWSTNVYAVPENKLIDDPCYVSVAGVTSTGEIVLAMEYTSKPYYVFYFNTEKNTLKSVEIEGFGAELEALECRGRVTAFVDYLEHLEVDDFKQSRMKHLCTKCKEHNHDADDSAPSELSIFDYQVKLPCSNCEEQEKMETQ